MRQIVLDTETTGLEYRDGHRIIEVGCVELLNRRLTGNNYHVYLQPDRLIDSGAMEVHGITNEFLADKPRFEDIVEDFLAYIQGAELVIHNAPFDVGFINNELTLLGRKSGSIGKLCSVLDTLFLARRLHPGQKNNLDALCKRYGVDNTRRDLHGALLDAEILADVYLGMTGGQTALSLGSGTTGTDSSTEVGIRRITAERPPLKVVRATDVELSAHQAALTAVEKAGGTCVWKELEQ
ncbi:DNA polymerase III subunit epsilon [Thiohalomonas denitrificans]|uniref:DNA polymerase III subunit epsilon n=1 Tax=Thiohalomonas denitrificans TaxID=415747 RepID=UPI0026EF1883|nr:DNA polymerase III subunit epsilon [Thiohalomonas denitrificans]